jgi:acetyl esterase/lipase
MPRVRSRPIRVIYLLILAISAALILTTTWILLPAPSRIVLPLAVGAPELSPLLLVFSILLIGVSAFYARDLHSARLALVLSLVSAVLCLRPLVQIPSTIRRFDESMRTTLGVELRGSPISYRELFRPPRALPSHVIRGVVFAEHGNTKIALDIYKPSSNSRGPFPVVLQVYGGAWQRGAPSDNDWFSRYLAAQGYVVVAVDYRHAPAWQWPAQFDDVRAALDWTRSHAKEFSGDPDRLVVLGRSSGAQLALLAAYQDRSASVRGVISYYGPVDLAAGWRRPPRPDPLRVREILEAYLGGTPARFPDRYRDASPVSFATRKLPPTLLIYGGRDHIVEARFGEELDRALKRAGTTSVLLEIPWSEHAFDAIPNGLGGQIALYYTERFLRFVTR